MPDLTSLQAVPSHGPATSGGGGSVQRRARDRDTQGSSLGLLARSVLSCATRSREMLCVIPHAQNECVHAQLLLVAAVVVAMLEMKRITQPREIVQPAYALCLHSNRTREDTSNS